MTYSVTNCRTQFPFVALTLFIFLLAAEAFGRAQTHELVAVKQIASKTPTIMAVRTVANVVGTWYYTAIIKADGTEQELSNMDSYLWLKEDGSYENRFSTTYGQIGTFAVNGNRLTLNREGGDKKVYTMEFGDGGKTMTLKSSAGGFKLKRE